MMQNIRHLRGLRKLIATCMIFWLAVAQPAFAQADEDEKEGGILGTGIVGLITELGSIYVNGHRITFDASLPVSAGLSPRTAATLEPGETIAAVVAPAGSNWQAVSIAQVYPIVGPIAEVGSDGITVMGTSVVARSAAVDFYDLSVGDWVAISGFWQFDRIMATHVRAIDPQAQAAIQGSFVPGKTEDVVRIGTSQVTGLSPQHAAPGSVVRATGTPVANGLDAQSIATGLFAQRPTVVQSEGYLAPADARGFYTLLGSGSWAYTDNPEMIDPAQTVVQCDIDAGLLAPGSDIPDGAIGDAFALLGCQ